MQDVLIHTHIDQLNGKLHNEGVPVYIKSPEAESMPTQLKHHSVLLSSARVVLLTMPRLENATHFFVTYVHTFTYIPNRKHENGKWSADCRSMVYEEIRVCNSVEQSPFEGSSHSAGQRTPLFLWNPKIYYCVQSGPSVSLTAINPVHILTHLYIIFSAVCLVTNCTITVLFCSRARACPCQLFESVNQFSQNLMQTWNFGICIFLQWVGSNNVVDIQICTTVF